MDRTGGDLFLFYPSPSAPSRGVRFIYLDMDIMIHERMCEIYGFMCAQSVHVDVRMCACACRVKYVRMSIPAYKQKACFTHLCEGSAAWRLASGINHPGLLG